MPKEEEGRDGKHPTANHHVGKRKFEIEVAAAGTCLNERGFLGEYSIK